MTDDLKDRKLRMLLPLAQVCVNCTMCALGSQKAKKGDEVHDPHVFSSFMPSRFMVVGQNPGWNEVVHKMPFVGDAGKNFDAEIAKHGLQRSDFYICNSVRCHTPGNTKPDVVHLERCEPFLRMEVQILKPKLIVALGAVAFDQLCPKVDFQSSLKRLTRSKYGVMVFPVYHPSPLNLDEGGRREAFEDQIRMMCALVQELRRREDQAAG